MKITSFFTNRNRDLISQKNKPANHELELKSAAPINDGLCKEIRHRLDKTAAKNQKQSFVNKGLQNYLKTEYKNHKKKLDIPG